MEEVSMVEAAVVAVGWWMYAVVMMVTVLQVGGGMEVSGNCGGELVDAWRGVDRVEPEMRKRFIVFRGLKIRGKLFGQGSSGDGLHGSRAAAGWFPAAGKLVNISKRRAFWSLNEDILKINDFDYQYAVSIKEDMTYPCLHSLKTTKETSSIRHIQRRSIRRIEDIVCEDSGRYQMWSSKKPPICRI
ncbi:hypothetical protein Tco_0915093 [Tanacetum coccineum]